MTEKPAEMSLDEMLSSIKQMVIDKDPPVLELTDMISPDGTIVKVKRGQGDFKIKNEMRDFLRLAQEESDTSLVDTPSEVDQEKSEFAESSETEKDKPEDLHLKMTETKSITSEKMGIVVSDVVREVATPIIEKWLEKNLPNLVREIVTAEVQKMVKQN